jgi:adenylate cyclase
MGRWRNRILSSLVLVLGLGLRWMDPAVLQEFEARYFDLLQELKPRVYAPTPTPVRIVDIDDASLERYGQWIWPRPLLAELIERINRFAPRAVALDMVLAEPDRTSPGRILQLFPSPPDAVGTWFATLPDSDHVFTEAISRAPVVTAFTLTPTGAGRAPELKASWVVQGDDPSAFIPGNSGTVTTLAEIEAAATGNGSLNAGDRDKVVRRVPMIVRYQDTLYPSLAAEALRVAQPEAGLLIRASGASGVIGFGQKTGVVQIKIGEHEVETDRSGAMWLYDTGHVPERAIPAWRVLDGSAPAAALNGAIVFIGTSAAALADLKRTPIAADVPGVEVHAGLVEQVLLHSFLRRPDYAAGAEMVYLVLLGLALILGLPRFGAARSAAFTATATAAVFASSWYAFSAFGLLFAPLYPSIVVLCVYLTASLINQLQTEADKRRIRAMWERNAPPAVVAALVKDPSKARLGGELRHMTFLFSDLRGFTSIAERCKSRPEVLTDIVNRFMTQMTRAIIERDGTIDKYMGDCVMAFWNAPLEVADHAVKACEAALTMRRALRVLNDQLAADTTAGLLAEGGGLGFRLESGIGINTGDCIAGMLGSEMQHNYSVIGDAVNLASRLESESKNYGVAIVIGEETAKLAEGFATVELDTVAVKGKREQTRVFTLLGDRHMGGDPVFLAFRSHHLRMLAAYRARDWRQARELIAACREFNVELSVLYDLYSARVDAQERMPPDESRHGRHAEAPA